METTFDMYDYFPCYVLRSVMQSRDIHLPILLLRLKSNYYDCDTKLLINSAILRGVQTLELNLISCHLKMKHLSNILTCKTLIVLKLTSLFIDEDVPQRNVSSIKTLHLNNVRFSREKHISFFLAFPSLEELHANNVRVLVRRGFIPQPMINCLPNLKRANISDIELIHFLCLSREFILNVNKRPHLKNIVGIPIFYNLTQMELVFNVDKIWSVKWKRILEMLHQSPKLQHLIIHEKIETENGTIEKNWEDPLIVPECLSSQLRTCLFRCCRGTECEVKFAEYVMRNSKVLGTMTIHTSSSINLNTKDEILQKLSDCPKSCKLLFD